MAFIIYHPVYICTKPIHNLGNVKEQYTYSLLQCWEGDVRISSSILLTVTACQNKLRHHFFFKHNIGVQRGRLMTMDQTHRCLHHTLNTIFPYSLNVYGPLLLPSCCQCQVSFLATLSRGEQRKPRDSYYIVNIYYSSPTPPHAPPQPPRGVNYKLLLLGHFQLLSGISSSSHGHVDRRKAKCSLLKSKMLISPQIWCY